MEHTKNVTISKCACGHPSCNQYFISSTHSDGRLDLADALLYAAAPEMLEMLVEIMSKRYGQIETYSFAKLTAVIEKATGKTIDEVIKNGLTK
jgi:hypothetical protein